MLLQHSAACSCLPADWDALIDDFITLGFLPRGCDRGALH